MKSKHLLLLTTLLLAAVLFSACQFRRGPAANRCRPPRPRPPRRPRSSRPHPAAAKDARAYRRAAAHPGPGKSTGR